MNVQYKRKLIIQMTKQIFLTHLEAFSHCGRQRQQGCQPARGTLVPRSCRAPATGTRLQGDLSVVLLSTILDLNIFFWFLLVAFAPYTMLHKEHIYYFLLQNWRFQKSWLCLFTKKRLFIFSHRSLLQGIF